MVLVATAVFGVEVDEKLEVGKVGDLSFKNELQDASAAY